MKESWSESVNRTKTQVYDKEEVLEALGIEVMPGWTAHITLREAEHGPYAGDNQPWKLIVTQRSNFTVGSPAL